MQPRGYRRVLFSIFTRLCKNNNNFAENYHLDEVKQEDYYIAEGLQWAFGDKAVEALAKCTIKGVQWASKAGKVAKGLEGMAEATKTATILEKGVQELGEGIKLAEELKEIGSIEASLLVGIRKNNKIEKELFNFTSTAAQHMNEKHRKIPIQILQDIIQSPISAVIDPQLATNAMMYYSRIWRNNKL